MQNTYLSWRASRALQAALLALGATIAFLVLGTTQASAQLSNHETNIQITNTGGADANTGRNGLVGNDSQNLTTTVQEPEEVEDGLVNVIADETDESDGSTSLETGSARAVGNAASNVAVQGTAVGSGAEAALSAAIGTPFGTVPNPPLVVLDEASPESATPAAEESTEAAAGLEVNDEGGADEAPDPSETTASTQATSESEGTSQSPASALPTTGSAAADAGAPVAPALATVPLDNTVLGAVSGAGPPGITNSEQEIEIENLGDATANTGENTVVDGDVLTGNATATGNIALNTTSQVIVALGELNELEQAIEITNEGAADANTGANEASGGEISTGAADAAGNNAATSAQQLAVAAGEQNLLDQAIDATNEGEANANTGENAVEDGEVATGDATASGNWSGTALGQRILTPASEDQNFIDQALEAANEGDALAVTGVNTAVAGEDGEVAILTGEALAIGNTATTGASQEAA